METAVIIGDETVINLQRAKVYVFSDSVLCLRRVHQHPESNKAWQVRIGWIVTDKSYRDYNGIKRELTEFEWNIFPGFTTLQLCMKQNVWHMPKSSHTEKGCGGSLHNVSLRLRARDRCKTACHDGRPRVKQHSCVSASRTHGTICPSQNIANELIIVDLPCSYQVSRNCIGIRLVSQQLSLHCWTHRSPRLCDARECSMIGTIVSKPPSPQKCSASEISSHACRVVHQLAQQVRGNCCACSRAVSYVTLVGAVRVEGTGGGYASAVRTANADLQIGAIVQTSHATLLTAT